MEEIKLTCPKCKEEFDFPKYDIVESSKEEKLGMDLRSNELFHATCPHCGFETYYDYSFLYKDKSKNYLLYYAANEEDYRKAFDMMTGNNPLMDKKLLEGWTKRLVTYRYDIQEKLMILDDGLDDRVIEIMKALAYTKLSQNEPEAKPDTVLFDKGNDGNHYFRFQKGNQVIAAYAFEKPLYNKMKEWLDPRLDDLQGNQVVINSQWAVESMTKLNKE